MAAERASSQRGFWLASVGLCLCFALLVVVLFRWAGPRIAGAATVPQPRPCTLGMLPGGADSGGGIVAALVSSTYPPQGAYPRGARFATPVPTATTETLCVLRQSDGALLAHFGLDSTYFTHYYVESIGVAPDGSAIYVASFRDTQPERGRMCALRPMSGTTIWCADLDAVPSRTMVVTGRDIFVETLHSLNAIDASTGRIRWRNADLVPQFTDFGFRPAGNLLVGIGGDDVAPGDEVCAWRIADGSVAWCTHTFQDVFVQDAGVDAAYVTMGISFADNSGLIEQLSAATGKVIWSMPLPSSRVFHIADAGGIAYVMPLADCAFSSATCQGTVLMVHAATGMPAGQFSVLGDVNTRIFVRNGVAITVTSAPGAMSGTSVPGARGSRVAFTYRPKAFMLGGAIVFDGSAYYTGQNGLGLLSFATGAPVWEADGCGDSLAGSAQATARDGATIWCHWPANSSLVAVAVQGELA
jgi:outer membrane protein assembly factor BamB